ncbi:MAG: HK97 gp10 family phage protein [Candidatus Paceibacterota bacterium]|jgi:hypothetical protein
MIKVTIKDRSKTFQRNVVRILKTGLVQIGQEFEQGVREKAPMASSQYANAGKLKQSIKSNKRVKINGSAISIEVSSNAKDHNNRYYAAFVEYGTPTIPPYEMFLRTSRETPEMFNKFIVEPLKNING